MILKRENEKFVSPTQYSSVLTTMKDDNNMTVWGVGAINESTEALRELFVNSNLFYGMYESQN